MRILRKILFLNYVVNLRSKIHRAFAHKINFI